MDITITPRKLHGTLRAIPSKSLLHRYLICAAFADKPTTIFCGDAGDDVNATVDCLCALGAQIRRMHWGYLVTPVQDLPKTATVHCRESGTTLRLLLPIVGALGIQTTFLLSGRLGMRPLSPLWEEMERMGCRLRKLDGNTLVCKGQLSPGEYHISGDVSSQFISGLLFALALIGKNSQLHIAGQIESRPYVEMTRDVLKQFQADRLPFHSPGEITVEGDWSNAAYFLAANMLGSHISLDGLNENSLQGDQIVTEYLMQLERNCTINLTDAPDLFPILAVVAATKFGATFTGIHRLQYKESNRIQSVCALLERFDIHAVAAGDAVTVQAGTFRGAMIDSYNDHRVAMAAAVAATIADAPVTIRNADCVSKSYPSFWEEYRKLGGVYAQYIR